MAELLSKLAAASRHAARIVGWRLAGRHDVGARCLAVVEALEGPHRVIADALRLGLAMHLTGATMVRVPEQPEDCLELLAGDDNVGYVMPITGPKVEKALEGPEPPLRVWMAVERLQRRCIAVEVSNAGSLDEALTKSLRLVEDKVRSGALARADEQVANEGGEDLWEFVPDGYRMLGFAQEGKWGLDMGWVGGIWYELDAEEQ